MYLQSVCTLSIQATFLAWGSGCQPAFGVCTEHAAVPPSPSGTTHESDRLQESATTASEVAVAETNGPQMTPTPSPAYAACPWQCLVCVMGVHRGWWYWSCPKVVAKVVTGNGQWCCPCPAAIRAGGSIVRFKGAGHGGTHWGGAGGPSQRFPQHLSSDTQGTPKQIVLGPCLSEPPDSGSSSTSVSSSGSGS